MASISFNINASGLNPTPGYLPYNGGDVFLNSPFYFDGSQRLSTYFSGSPTGLVLDYTANKAILGFGNTITVGSGISAGFRLDGTQIISGTAGSNSANHLSIVINGSAYKIQLKNPS